MMTFLRFYGIIKLSNKTIPIKNGEKIIPNNKYSQISLSDIYEDVNTSFTEKKSELVSLLEEHIDFSSLITYEFRRAFYKSFVRKHKYHLESFIKALIIQKLFAFNLDSQLILVLKNSDELRDFCGFNKVPDGSYFSRFKQKYCNYLVELFHDLVDITEPICREIDSKKADYLIFDTTSLEPYVAENNPKFFNTKLKAVKKLLRLIRNTTLIWVFMQLFLIQLTPIPRLNNSTPMDIIAMHIRLA